MKTIARLGDRRHLMTLSVVLASGVGAAAILFALPPYQRRSLEMAAHQKLDAISVAYLRVMLRAYPEDREARYSLVRALAETGKYSEARATLVPLTRETGGAGAQARLALLNIYRTELRQTAQSDPRRNRMLASLGREIADMLALPATLPVLLELHAASLELDRQDLVLLSLDRLAHADAARRVKWLDEEARGWLAQGLPARAAALYRDIAMLDDAPASGRRRYALLALDTFVAANEGAAALAFAESARADVRQERAFLERALAVAQSQDNAKAAQSLGRQLLALNPDSPASIERQLDLELAAGALPAALQLAERLVEAAPSSAHRTRLATIAEWSAAQAIALRQWTLLARQEPAGAAMTRALELARARGQDALWLELAALAGAHRALSADEQAVLLSIAQDRPGERRLAATLDAILARQPGNLGLWLALSDAQQRSGDQAGALASLRKIPPALAGPVDIARLEASLLMRGGLPQQALARLNAVRGAASPTDSTYWTLLGDLAWETNDRAAALRAYAAAWDGGASDARIAERLIETSRASGDFEQAVRIAREADRRLAEPRWLLLAMDAAFQGERWDALRADLAAAAARPEQFEQVERYWIFTAQQAARDGRKPVVRQAYRRALALAPDAVSTRAAWLWFEVDSGDGEPLRTLLADWADDAVRNDAYWGPFAVGMMRLQRPADALPWFERQVRAHPDDAAWSLEYAEALALAGRADEARPVRRLAYLQLKPHFHSGFPPRMAMPDPLLLSYVALVREFEGEAPAQALLVQLIERGNDPATARVRLVDSFLAQKKFGQARAWLQRASLEQRTMPAWQYLAVAQADNDRQEIASILATRAAQLSPLDRIAALRKLGRGGEALALAEAEQPGPDRAVNATLSEVAEQLRREQGKRASVVFEAQQLGYLDLRKWELAASAPTTLGRGTVRLARNTFEGDNEALLLAQRAEEDLSATLVQPLGNGDLRMTLGANRQAGASMAYGELAWTRPLNDALTLRLDGAANKLSEESALMRLLGKKSRAGAALTLDPGAGKYARVELAGQRYAARSGQRLGSGYRIEGELGMTMRDEFPQLRVRLSASFEHNRLADGLLVLPRDVFVPADQAAIGNVVPARFGWAGAGATLLFGQQDSAAGRPYGALDALVGRQWPGGRSAYGIRARLVLPLGARDELNLDAVHSNVQSSDAAPANRRLQFSYVHRF